MRTYPIKDETGRPFALEVDVVSCSVRDLVKVIAAVEGVTDAKAGRPSSSERDVRATFRYQGDEFAVVEPFGDNSRYWIGPVSDNLKRDVSPIDGQLRSYVPSFFRRVLGGLVTLNFRTSSGG
ncbi:MAG: hypothetical protein KIT37_14465 [Steroidobacteraceae bacterium]|nr:hypothetical protein [Steroidobacteraceae bacterium]